MISWRKKHEKTKLVPWMAWSRDFKGIGGIGVYYEGVASIVLWFTVYVMTRSYHSMELTLFRHVYFFDSSDFWTIAAWLFTPFSVKGMVTGEQNSTEQPALPIEWLRKYDATIKNYILCFFSVGYLTSMKCMLFRNIFPNNNSGSLMFIHS